MIAVVPLAGTWIETITPSELQKSCIVVPLAGTWIETGYTGTANPNHKVVPLAGTWIETTGKVKEGCEALGRSPCGNVD